ncbi:hypothetical protein NDU88_001799 [Pleurodeles waltl]|uniref:Uncharacterized protein n=1 Tax=Pleurodeles waltl TaxID=8319 RepID=A0AAV7LC42_PLEWA|nr:hypothetical protein NDU88_001799 [Pleurodeles waltl]
MDTEAKVREALALLRQAGRLDLLRDGALAPTRPARRASAGVAAAVAACSPPRVASAGKVRGAASGVGTKGGPGAGGRRFYGWERTGESQRVARGTGRTVQRKGCSPVQKRRAGAQVLSVRQAGVKKRAGALEHSGKKNSKGGKAGTRQGRSGAFEDMSHVSGLGAHVGPVGFSGTEDAASGKREKAGTAGGTDSGLLDLGVSAGGVVPGLGRIKGLKGTPRSPCPQNGRPCSNGALMRREGVRRAKGARRVGDPHQADLGVPPAVSLGHVIRREPLDYGDEDPGEQDAARVRWGEGKAGPWAASRITSTGWRRRRSGAADASTGRCGGEGVAPPGAAAQKERRPGPSRRREKGRREYSNCVRCGGAGANVIALEERSEESLEEGELRNSGSEYEWWESGGRGSSNPVRQSLQVLRSGTWRGASRGERIGREARSVQERPPLLSPGICFTLTTMVFMHIQAHAKV